MDLIHDTSLMARALQLARRGQYSAMPNPHVGCVLVRDGHIIGEGYTRPAGGNHAEVEALLYGHPAIQEACVIGATDAHRGETVKAVVVIKEASRGKVSEQDVIDWARANMAAYKAPRIVAFVDALPKSATGKIMWRALQEKGA